MDGQAEKLIKEYKSYSLKPFKEIIREILIEIGPIDKLKGKRILELGPGKRVNMLRFLSNEVEAEEVYGVGKETNWFVFRYKKFKEKKIKDAFLPDYLKKMADQSMDVIYSRYFFEQYSINSKVLLTSRVYWQYVAKDKFKDQKEDFWGSMENLKASLKETVRILKPGGILISHIAKKLYSVLKEENLIDYDLERFQQRPLGKFSEIVTIVR